MIPVDVTDVAPPTVVLILIVLVPLAFGVTVSVDVLVVPPLTATGFGEKLVDQPGTAGLTWSVYECGQPMASLFWMVIVNV